MNTAVRPPEGGAVLLELQEGVATITLDQGERMNPLTPALQQGLLDAVRQVRGNTAVRAVLLTARGRGFCVGADLADLRERAAGPDGGSIGSYVGRMMEESGNRIMAGLRSLPVPVVCAVNGVAAGGGVGLALAADVVIAARSAYFYLPFVPSLGLVPDMGASWLLPRALGPARAMGLALTGAKLDAQQAADWGLIWACVDDERLAEEGQRLAARLAGLPPGAIDETRALFAAAERNSFTEQLALERERQAVLADGESFAEGVRAFAERRRPSFRGRG
jgi:2-(1,2-epoxy-1,2-dihydrophenyl)acetyl-CoA isomerase